MKIGDIKNPKAEIKRFPAVVGYNMGNRTLSFTMSLSQFREISKVHNPENESDPNKIAQRDLDINHCKGLAKHILVGLIETQIRRYKTDGETIPKEVLDIQQDVGKSPYAVIQPFVCNIRECSRDGDDLDILDYSETNIIWNVGLKNGQILSVVDGQHRRKAFDIVYEWLDKVVQTAEYPKASFIDLKNKRRMSLIDKVRLDFWNKLHTLAFQESQIRIECHLGLKPEEERQLFADLNDKGKKVEKSLSDSFDQANPINEFIQKKLLKDGVIKNEPISKDTSSWHSDTGQLLRKDITPITTLAMFGKTSSKKETPASVREKADFAVTFWKNIHYIKNFGKNSSRSMTIAAQPVVLKGIAKLAFDLGYGKQDKNEEHLIKLWEHIKSNKLDFSHNNDIWQALFLDSSKRKKIHSDIDAYVHVPDGTNLDAGTYDEKNKWVRFGNKHNDIYPRIGDLIRYKLGFNPRASVKRSIEASK